MAEGVRGKNVGEAGEEVKKVSVIIVLREERGGRKNVQVHQ